MATTNLVSQSYGDVLLECGSGSPDHTSPKGSLYMDLDVPEFYNNRDGTTTWDIIGSLRFIAIRLVESDTDVVVATSIRGDWVCPFTGTLVQDDNKKEFFSAATDTAGTTGTMVVDVHKGGTTVMTTNKLDIETTEKSTTTAATQPDLTTTVVTAGDVFTFDVDAKHTTAAKGLTIYMAIRMT